MKRRIPKEYIDRFLALPDKGAPQQPNSKFSIEELINNGKSFYSDAKDDKGNYIGVAVALEKTLEFGSAATLPQLITGKAQAEKNNYLWNDWFTTYSEEVIGTHEGQEYLVIVHGGGILTPERIKKAIKDGLINGSAKLSQEEFDSLFSDSIPVYDSVEQVIDPFGHYSIKMPLKTASKTESGSHKKKEFLNNPLVQARVGTKQYLEEYFNKAESSGTVGNYHWLSKVDASISQARLLFVLNSNYGLNSYSILLNYGRFVGVARAKKMK